jgi:hypothetical protein
MSGYIGSTPVPQSVQTRDAFIATAGQTSFGSSGYAPGFLDVYLNGIKLASEDYTATNGSDIVLTSGASLDDILEVVAFESFEVANTLPLTGGTFTGDIGITSADPILTIRDTETSTSSSNARLRLAESGAGSSLDNYFDVGFVADKFTIGSNSVADALTIARDTGNTGIGTNTPSAKLELSSSATDHLRLTRSTNNWDVGVGSTGDLITKLGGADIMRIDASGNLLVGKTSLSTSTVGVQATEFGAVYATRSSGAPFICNRTTTDGTATVFMRSAVTVGTITVTGSSTSYNTSSDYRLKEAWVPMAGASARVQNLKPVNFAWKIDGSRVDGFLAHELQEVVPEAAHGVKDEVDAEGNPVMQGIDQSKLVPLLTAALQEALTEIESLKATNIAIEARLTALEGV